MKKLIPLFLTLLLLTATACSSRNATPSQAPTTSPSNPQTYTGILEENKGFMITVAPENKKDDTVSYVFGTDGITVDAKVGNKVTITYTGDINEVGGLLEATKVEVVN